MEKGKCWQCSEPVVIYNCKYICNNCKFVANWEDAEDSKFGKEKNEPKRDIAISQ